MNIHLLGITKYLNYRLDKVDKRINELWAEDQIDEEDEHNLLVILNKLSERIDRLERLIYKLTKNKVC